MGRKCSVEGCLSDSNRPEDIGVTFHKVPMHSDVRPKWMSLCHIPEDKRFVKIIYVCSRHFLRADFCNFKGKKYMLRQGVLPSVFPWDKSKLEAIKTEATRKKEKPTDESNLEVVKDETPNIECKAEVFEAAVKMENLEEMDVIEGQIKVESKEKLDEFEKSKIAETAEGSLNFVINSRIEALDFNNEWFPAKIAEVDYEENEVLIHFEKFSTKYDEWISMNSSRLRPLQTKKLPVEQFEVGEKCLAAWSDYRKFKATITKVMDNGTYEVLFDDGFVKVLKGHRISKTQVKPMQQSPLFEPIKTSKQDRRDKKRKINVAQLFRKRQRIDHSEDKNKKSASTPSDVTQQSESVSEPAELDSSELSTSTIMSVPNLERSTPSWKPQWLNGAPVGTPSSIDTSEGPKPSIILPDPRIPQGWNKHVVCKNQGPSLVKWDVIIVSPDNRKFKTRADLRKYLQDHPIAGINESMFDFGLLGRPRRKRSLINSSTPKKINTDEIAPPAPEYTEMQDFDIKEEENANTLKILFEDDTYKCPIEGCGKIFRRENLAQMHVKHYHPEYTKFLDSTPNVADLAYARTVGENLDRSPGPPTKPPSLKLAVRTSTPKASKLPQSPLVEMPDSKPTLKTSSPIPLKPKDSEIIKLLNSKPFDLKDTDTVNTSTGLPTNKYPDIKLKDLLHKSESVPKRDENAVKNLASARPPTGIKTLLPVVRSSIKDDNAPSPSVSEDTTRLTGKRKKGFTENIEIIKGKESQPSQHLQQNQPSTLPSNSISLTSGPSQLSLDTLQQSSPAPPLPPNNIIIEGGEMIKIVRMKQEEIINCTCGFTEEDGLMIQCELCLCWQHAYCNNIEKESQVPEKYICFICQNPLRERLSRKYYHDQDWLKQGTLPVGSYHTKDEEVLSKRFEKLKKCHDLSGGLVELREYMHSLGIKLKIAEAKNHPKLYLWSKPWVKLPLPEKLKLESDDVKPLKEDDFVKDEDDDKSESQTDPMIMMLLKAEKESMSKIDLNSLMDNNIGAPIIPRPEAAIDSADCRLNLLEHIQYQESLVEERLDDFEKQIDALEEGMNMESDPNYPKTRHTLQMLVRDLETLKEFSRSTTI